MKARACRRSLRHRSHMAKGYVEATRGATEHELDHVGLDVSDYNRSKAFYEQALAPLGIKCEERSGGGWIGDEFRFWIARRPRPDSGTHVAFNTGIARVDALTTRRSERVERPRRPWRG